MELQDQLSALISLMAIVVTVTMGILALYGYWIWDLNKKVSTAVTGPECETRNENHYTDTRELRLEGKADMKELSDQFDADLSRFETRVVEGMKRMSKEHTDSLKILKEQMIDNNKTIAAQNQANIDQHQSNFTLVVGVLREIGCRVPRKG